MIRYHVQNIYSIFFLSVVKFLCVQQTFTVLPLSLAKFTFIMESVWLQIIACPVIEHAGSTPCTLAWTEQVCISSRDCYLYIETIINQLQSFCLPSIRSMCCTYHLQTLNLKPFYKIEMWVRIHDRQNTHNMKPEQKQANKDRYKADQGLRRNTLNKESIAMVNLL